MLLKLAWKNMWRNRHRTLIVLTSIAFALILSVIASSLKTGIFDNLIANLVGYYSGYLQIQKTEYWDERILDNSFSSDSSMEKLILSDSRITTFSPRLESFALISSEEKTKGCLVVGILPESENQITNLKGKLIEGKYIQHNDPSVMISDGLMKRLQLKIGDTVVLIGQGYHGSMAAGKFKVMARLHFGSPDLNDKALFMPLFKAQDMYAADKQVTSYVLSLKNPNDMYAIEKSLQHALGKAYAVMSWEEMMPDIRQHIRGDSANMQIVQFILYILVSFGIFSTILVQMEERKFEMGMLVAIGMQKSSLALVLFAESVFTMLLGCLVGVLISIPIVYFLHDHPLRISGETARAYERFGFEPVFPAAYQATHFIRQVLIVCMVGCIISLYPVYKSFSLNMMQSMRK